MHDTGGTAEDLPALLGSRRVGCDRTEVFVVTGVSVQQRRVWRPWGREFLRQRRVTPSRREIDELVQELERVASDFFRRGARLAMRQAARRRDVAPFGERRTS
jgi:hypothetical protein